jgi:SAM-dependent methyltransferase
VPREVAAALESGWLPEGAPALDIGCGEGEIAAWLAARGCPAVGVDIAPSALALARERFPESPGRLEFHAIDVCREAPPDRQYRILVDRACYHQIAPADRRAYWRSIAAVSAPGARLLLLARVLPGWLPDDPAAVREVRHMIEDGLDGAFSIERTTPSELAHPALAVWMVRRRV